MRIKCSFCKIIYHEHDLLIGRGDQGQSVDMCIPCSKRLSLDVCTKCARVVCKSDVDGNHTCKHCNNALCSKDQMKLLRRKNCKVEVGKPISEIGFMKYVDPYSVPDIYRKRETVKFNKGKIGKFPCMLMTTEAELYVFVHPHNIRELERIV